MVAQRFFKIVRPIFVSALLLFCAAVLVQYCVTFFIPSFDILASKDMGKIVFTLLIFGSLSIFILQQTSKFQHRWWLRNIHFLYDRTQLHLFWRCFVTFFMLHALLLGSCYFYGLGSLQTIADVSIIKIIGQLLFGFLATFMLALTEEIMFRGTLYPYFAHWLRPITAVFVTSLSFMLVHFFPSPVAQIQRDLPIAIGLFLLGFMLNLIFITAGSMYANIGTHAGLVYVKVILRKARFFVLASTNTLPWFLHTDLRQAPIVHALFGLIIVGLIVHKRDVLFAKPTR